MISVIVPTYNQSQFLTQAIESISSQQIEDLETIVIDDGSTDDTATVLEKLFKREHFRFIRQENAGPAAARNRGIRESRGDLIAFLDGDDFWLPGKIKAQLAALRQTGHRFSFCGEQTVDDRGRVLARRFATDKDGLFAELIWGNRISTPTVLVQRSLLEECGLFDESLRTGEDWDLWLRFAASGPGACVPEPLVAVRGNERWQADVNQLAAYEHSTKTVLNRIFKLVDSHEELAGLKTRKARVRSWHFATLAKSLLNAGQYGRASSYMMRAVTSSPRALTYLMPAPGSHRLEKTGALLATNGRSAGAAPAISPVDLSVTNAPLDFPVSVVIRTYNRAAMLREALDSALNQTLPPKEIVVVDDGSTDETSELVNLYVQKHPEVRYVRTEGNFGADRAAKLGVEESTSTYIAFLDSDDLWLPIHLENAAGHFRNDPGLVMVFSRYGLVNAQGELLVDVVKEPRLTSPLRQLVLKKIIVQPTRTVIRRQTIADVGGVPLFPAAEDWVLAVLVAARFPGGIAQSTSRTVVFRLHPSQSASRPLQVRQTLLDATRHIFTQIPSEFSVLEHQVTATNLMHSAVFLWQAGNSSEAWLSLLRAVRVRALSVTTQEFWTALPRLLVPPAVGRVLRGWKRSSEKRRSQRSLMVSGPSPMARE